MTIEKQKLILENSGYYLSNDTLEKLNNGYKKASNVLANYIGNGKIIITEKNENKKTLPEEKPETPQKEKHSEKITRFLLGNRKNK